MPLPRVWILINRDKFHDTVPLTSTLLFRNDEHALIISSLLEAIFLHGYQEHGVKVRETVPRFCGSQMHPAIASAIVTGDAPASYWQCFIGRPVARRKDYSWLIYCYLFIYFWISSHPCGYPTKLYIREAPCRGPIPYSFMYQFFQKRCPFRIPLNDKWYPFHILVQNTASLLEWFYLSREICSIILRTIVLLCHYLHLLTCSYFSLVSICFTGQLKSL